MRIAFALCSVLLCSCCGNAMAKGVQERIALLNALGQDIAAMRGWIAYGGYPLKTVLGRLHGARTGTLWRQAEVCAASAQPFAVGWRACVESLRKRELAPLTQEEFEAVAEFGAALGAMKETAQQVRHLDAMAGRLAGFAQSARQEAAKKCKLYRSLGALGGLALGIVVL